MQRCQNRIEKAFEQINAPRSFEHADRHQHRHEKGNDFENDVEGFLRAFDEFVVNLDPRAAAYSGKKLSKKGIARIDKAFTARTNPFGGASAGISKPNKPGAMIRVKRRAKKKPSANKESVPQTGIRSRAGWVKSD